MQVQLDNQKVEVVEIQKPQISIKFLESDKKKSVVIKEKDTNIVNTHIVS